MLIKGLPALEAPNTSAAAPASAPGGPGFASVVSDAIAGAAESQDAAQVEVQKLARGEGNLHDAALALEKADISMRLMTKARNKIVEAYQEIMRTPV